jgi:hypothetical protein
MIALQAMANDVTVGFGGGRGYLYYYTYIDRRSEKKSSVSSG